MKFKKCIYQWLLEAIVRNRQVNILHPTHVIFVCMGLLILVIYTNLKWRTHEARINNNLLLIDDILMNRERRGGVL